MTAEILGLRYTSIDLYLGIGMNQDSEHLVIPSSIISVGVKMPGHQHPHILADRQISARLNVPGMKQLMPSREGLEELMMEAGVRFAEYEPVLTTRTPVRLYAPPTGQAAFVPMQNADDIQNYMVVRTNSEDVLNAFSVGMLTRMAVTTELDAFFGGLRSSVERTSEEIKERARE